MALSTYVRLSGFLGALSGTGAAARVTLAAMTDLLLIVPHPDDEAFGAGALLARSAAAGLGPAVLTLTKGAAGRTLGLCTRAELPQVREAELRAALQALGVTDVTIADYQDYVPDDDRGMPPHPGLAAVPEDELLDLMVETIESRKPRAVLTFPPNGSNGHPDHVVTSRLATEAVRRASHQVEALYYYASERRFEGPQRPGFLPEEDMRRLQLMPTHSLSAGAELAVKLSAIACHETQALSIVGFMRHMAGRLLEETFHRAQPPVEEGARVTVVEML